MKVKEWKGDVVFLHEVAAGAADRSYGIQVAKLAGLPPAVIERGKAGARHARKGRARRDPIPIIDDLPLFAAKAGSGRGRTRIRRCARSTPINPDELSPKEALERLYELKRLAARERK